jgi:hypothetical protein
MHLPRWHLFEVEDQSWCPATIRDLATDYLLFIESKFDLHRPIVTLLSQALRTTKAERVIDLCSGGGGPIPAFQHALAADGLAVEFTLTDRYPNVRAFERIASQSPEKISYVMKAVDARTVPADLTGFRTLFNSFHHFRPADAMAVLADASRQGQPVGIFEIPERSLRTILSVLFLAPFMVVVATPFIRPFRWTRLLWTYLIPIVPLVCWWDGVVSQLRAYTAPELAHLAETVSSDAYSWHAGRIPISSMPGYWTYLIGYPRKTVNSR